jgi:hypothetical protein
LSGARYLLRAFLQYNRMFRIVLMSNYLDRFHRDRLEARMPLCLRNCGGSMCLRREDASTNS